MPDYKELIEIEIEIIVGSTLEQESLVSYVFLLSQVLFVDPYCRFFFHKLTFICIVLCSFSVLCVSSYVSRLILFV